MNSANIGTWNVLTPLKPGIMQELAEQIVNAQLEIVAIQETGWNGIGPIKKIIVHYATVDIIKQARLELAL